MMDHIRQIDWCPSDQEEEFVTEEAIDRCVITSILNNRFRDPLVSSDEEDVGVRCKTNWSELLRQKNKVKTNRVFVAGFRELPPYPKLSALTVKQHYNCLKVLCAKKPNVLAKQFIPKPSHQDLTIFKEFREVYAKERQEFIEWAKTLWTSNHCGRALRPKRPVEMVYDTECRLRAASVHSYPTAFKMAAHLPLEHNDRFDMVLLKDLIPVNVLDLPEIEVPDLTQERFTIMRQFRSPRPCDEHPCRFVLPGENSVSVLPLPDICLELARYAFEAGARHIMSEGALRCLMARERAWALPLVVCNLTGIDGDEFSVVVLCNEANVKREPAPARTYRAYRHMLLAALAKNLSKPSNAVATTRVESQPPELTTRTSDTHQGGEDSELSRRMSDLSIEVENLDHTSDEERDNLIIDLGEAPAPEPDSPSELCVELDGEAVEPAASPAHHKDNEGNSTWYHNNTCTDLGEAPAPEPDSPSELSQSVELDGEAAEPAASPAHHEDNEENSIEYHNNTCKDQACPAPEPDSTSHPTESVEMDAEAAETTAPNPSLQCAKEGNGIGHYTCTCKGSKVDQPFPRSYKKWQLRNTATDEHLDVIIHCSHKVRMNESEVIVEPIPEYQLELAGSAQAADTVRGLAVALRLRTNASLLNVRIDGVTGEVVTADSVDAAQFQKRHGDLGPEAAGAAYTLLRQLQDLRPGTYLLRHEANHGSNVMVYATSGDGEPLLLQGDARAEPACEVDAVKTPPTLVPTLLPWHKYRKILPCAFTPFRYQLPRAVRQQQPRSRPPQAIKWPSKKRNKWWKK